MPARVGIDTGGTFTDLVLFDEKTCQVTMFKKPSTPDHPADAIFHALDASHAGPADVTQLVVGTTISTNTLIQRTGPTVVYITTEGFRDVPFIQRVDRQDPYELTWQKPQPLVERRSALEVRERIGAEGQVITALTSDALAELTRELTRQLPTDAQGSSHVLAVNLLFAYANPEHENLLGQWLGEHLPHLHYSLSHEVSSVWREYERASTTIVDAYLKPVVTRFLDVLTAELAQRGYACPLAIMKSNGGQVLAESAAHKPVQTVLSGLSGGIVAGKAFGSSAGEANVITLDMGGTSADVGMVSDGEIGYVAEFDLAFGLPIVNHAIDLVAVGAGGGSIAWIDEGGLLNVGPQSAGAQPGPVCYGFGGTDVTVSDANLVLNRLNADYFLGGEMALERDLAVTKTAELGRRLGLGLEETAQAIIEIANENMANLIRQQCAHRGTDPRDFALVAFGGAGPLHAVDVAASLGVETVVVPPHPGLASALGTLLASPRAEIRRTDYRRSDSVTPEFVDALLEDMTVEAVTLLEQEGFTGEPAIVRTIGMRYIGQHYDREVIVRGARVGREELAEAVRDFHRQHESSYGYSFSGEAVEFVHFCVTAAGKGADVRLPTPARGPLCDPHEVRQVWFDRRGWVETPIYRRSALCAGVRIDGPAVIEEVDATTLVPHGYLLEMHSTGSLRLTNSHQNGAEGAVADTHRRAGGIDMSIMNGHLVSIAQEMGLHMMRTAYSAIFSESRDFSCAVLNAQGDVVGQGRFCPSHLGALSHTVKSVLSEFSSQDWNPGDVVLHNDPYRGGCHMPEHMLVRPVFCDGALVAFVSTIGHLAEIGAMVPGSFASNATEVYQEGLRLPPVHLMRAGEPNRDVWEIILANHRTPRSSSGDLHAMVGSLAVGERRLQELFSKYGAAFVLSVTDDLMDYSERLVRAQLQEVPAGRYECEDYMEGDGVTATKYRLAVTVDVSSERLGIDYSGSDAQARGPINATYGVSLSAAYNAVLQICSDAVPRNAGTYRCLDITAPEGSIVNVRFPGPSVGGNTETHPKLVGIILGALADAIPNRIMAAEGGTACNFLFGGVDPRTSEYVVHYHFEASGWGGRADGDGNSAQNHIIGNCRNTPVEIFESRFPLRVLSYSLIADSGGAGRGRGGLGTRRILEVCASELTVSALMERVESGAWGLFGGHAGRPAAILIRRCNDSSFGTFSEVLGTTSPSKFSNVVLHKGDQVMIESAGGGGFGPPAERERERVLRDVQDGYVSVGMARDAYDVVFEPEKAEAQAV